MAHAALHQMESAWDDLTGSWPQAEVGLAGSRLVPSVRERIQCRSLQVMFFRPIFFSQAPRYCGTLGTLGTWGTSWPTPGCDHDTRPLRRTLVCRQFPTTLACDRGSQGLSAGGARTGPPCKSTAKDHPDHVPSQRGLEGTRRLRTSTLGRRLAENPLRPRPCRNLTAQRG